ncbi:hypothetical protein E2C01_030354 [Portunus trituberculatus]|uniref:Uncharacterized protein n=1 Tax=Portunus trituberculatus TaxID=210409 RepID=A0A5B7EU14_PORTR|nr:hypothetical protein [Portunus trituberculatus]
MKWRGEGPHHTLCWSRCNYQLSVSHETARRHRRVWCHMLSSHMCTEQCRRGTTPRPKPEVDSEPHYHTTLH